MSLAEHRIDCAGIGSVVNRCFGRAVALGPNADVDEADDTEGLTAAVAQALAAGDMNNVSLGFECPLFVPLPDDPTELTKARHGEGFRPWSAGAGCGALATGVTQTVWILSKLKEQLPAVVPAFVNWSSRRPSWGALP